MRLNWFSPLPPARSGIADYTARILPALQRQAEIILWTDQDDWDPTLEYMADVQHYHVDRLPWAKLNRADLSVYHLGNNPRFHTAIWQVSRSQSGVVVLHDLCLHHFFAGVYRDQWNERAGYMAQLERYYREVGQGDAGAYWSGRLQIDYMAEHYPLTSLAAEQALGLLVHTQEGQDLLQREVRSPVVYAPLPYPASPPPDRHQSATSGAATGDQPCRLIVFGYLDTNRRLDVLLQATAALPERDQFRIAIYGELWNDNTILPQVQALGLQHVVTVHGFVPEAELDAALAGAHLAVNLRFPTMGEASLSQLRIWDHALPALVTRVGWYASLPEDVVAFVRPEHELIDIQAHLRALLADPQRFRQMGWRGRHLLEQHYAPEAYAEAVVALAAEAQRFRSQATAHMLATRVGAELQAWTALPATPIVSPLWEQRPALDQQRGDLSQHAAALQGIRQAVAVHIERLRLQRATALQGIRRAVEEHIERLAPPGIVGQHGSARD